MHIAASAAGFETIGFAEIDPFCCALLAQYWPEIKNYGDVKRTDQFRELAGRVDVLSAGVPCQPSSQAGKRLGSRDDRWLWPHTVELVQLIRPAWCIFENPLGILSLDEFEPVRLSLVALGYALRAFSVPANAIGAQHLRYRVFLVADAGSETALQRSRLREGESGRERGRRPDDSSLQSDVADADQERCRLRVREAGNERSLRSAIDPSGEAMADATRSGRNRRRKSDPARSQCNGGQIEFEGLSEALSDADTAGLQERLDDGAESDGRTDLIGGNGREPEPGVRRMVDGIPDWVHTIGTAAMPAPITQGKVLDRADRLKALGNACVSAQVYPFFEAIREVEK